MCKNSKTVIYLGASYLLVHTVLSVHVGTISSVLSLTNKMSIRIIMVLFLMASWASNIVDGAEPVYLKVLEGFEGFYLKDVVLMLLRKIYGLCRAAMAFWKEMLQAFKSMKFEHSTADPCMYYKWTIVGFLIVWLCMFWNE